MRERRMSKYIVSIVLALAMVIGIAVFTLPTTTSADTPAVWDGTVASGFAGGNGTQANPYQIATPAQFAYFAKRNNEHTGSNRLTGEYYVLTADIVFNTGDASTWGTTAPANDTSSCMVGTVWGYTDAYNCFAGTFNGQGHSISGFYVNKSSETAGIFCSIAGDTAATIKNLVVTNSYIKSSGNNVGAITGQSSGTGAVYDCIFITDSVYVTGAQGVGGILGCAGGNGFPSGTKGATFSNCVSGATVKATRYSGGILGNGNGGSVRLDNSLNYGTITRTSGSASEFAGVVGNNSAVSTINYCVNIGTIQNNSGGSIGSQIIRGGSSSKKHNLTGCLALTTSYGNYVSTSNCAQISKEAFLTKGFLSTTNGSKISSGWTELAYETSIPNGTRTVKEICMPTGLVTAIGRSNLDFDKLHTNLCVNADAFPAPAWILTAWNSGTITISTVAEWKVFANFVNGVYEDKCTDNMSEKTVLLDDDLDFEGEDITEFIVGNAATKAFKGTFDGQGHTISGVYMYKSSSDGDTVGLFGFTAAGDEATLQNLLITDSYFEAEAGAVAALLAQTAGGVTNINNIYVTDSVEIVAGNSYAGGVAAHNGANGFGNPQIYIDSCVNAATVTSTSTAVGGILGNGNGQVHSVTNCLNMGAITGSKSVGGIVGYGRANAGVDVNIEFCVNLGLITSSSSTNVEKACAISSMGTTARDTLTSYGCYYLNGTATYGVFEGSGESADGGATAVVLSVLLDATLPEGLEESGNWIARGDGTDYEVCIPAGVEDFAPATTSFHTVDNTPNWLKNYSSTSSFTITTVAQWKQFADFVNGLFTTNGNFSGKTVNLGANLDFEGQNMTSYVVGAWNNPFCGTFDGQGYTISGYYVKKTGADTAGIFGSTAGGGTTVIQNLKIADSYFEAAGCVGALIGQTSGGSTEIYNVYVDSDVEIVATGNFAGGLVGHVGQNGFDFIADTPVVIIDSCANAATISASGRTCVGGILGNANNKSVTITNCLNLGDVTGGSNVGGIIGKGDGGTTTCEIYIDGCINAGAISGSSNVAAITVLSANGTREATNCYFILGTADNGVVSGTTVENVRAVSVYKLGKTTLMPGLDSDCWTVRGTASYFELCVPTAIEDMIPAGTQYSLSGYDVPSWLQNYDNDSTFTITSVARFKEFANFVNGVYMDQGNFEGKTVLLSTNISFNTGDASTWGDTPATNDCTQYIVGSWANPFCGNFNGQNHTISGFYAKKEVGDGDTVAIFGATTYGGATTIQNLLVTNSYFEAGDGAVAAVVGQAHGGTTTLNNIYVAQSVYVVSGNSFAGGVIAHLGQGSFSAPSLIVDSCVNAATISAMYDYNSEDEDEKAAAQNCTSYGGVVGNGNMKNVTITNCLNIGSVSGYQHVSGILGYGKPGSTTITGCVNAGIITSTYTGTVGKSAAITNLGNVETENYTLENNFYVTGSARYGSFLVNAELDGGATAVAQKELCLSTLVSGLPSNKWTARGNESANPQIREICIPTAVSSFAPQSPLYKTVSFLSGAGTQGNPYTVSSIADYNKLVVLSEDEDFAGKYISITTNLTFNTGSSADWIENGAPSVTTYPIGLYTNPFRGILLGNGHTISGLYVVQRTGEANNGAGIIATTGDGAQISNLYITNSVINDIGWAGTVVGQTIGNVTISGIYVDEDVYVNATKGGDGNTNSGGIIGGGSSNNSFTITVQNCVFAGTVNATGKYVGGIVGNGNGNYVSVSGRQHDVVITNCLSFGQIGVGEGAQYASGIIGTNRSTTTITNTIYAGNGSKSDYDNWGYISYPIGEMVHATVTNCYTIVTNGEDNTGAVMKAVFSDDTTITKASTYGVIDGKVNLATLADVCGPSLSGFTSGWTFRGTSSTSGAITSGVREIAIPSAVSSFAPHSKYYLASYRRLSDKTLFAGSGSYEDPYTIWNSSDLQTLATVANANDLTGMYFVVKSGFTVNSGKSSDWAAGNNTSGLTELTPIGNATYPFNASLDGYGKTIKGIYMTNTNSCTGLFGCVGPNGYLKNIKISNSYFEDTTSAATFVSSVNGAATLDGLYAGADVIVKTTGNNAGGIAAILGASGATIKNCVFTGTVTAGGSYVGGILGNGDGESLTVQDCLNTGDVTGSTYVAGIVGRNDKAFTMTRCINVGAISGSSDVYALTASNSTSKKPVVSYCYYVNTLSAGKNLAETSNSGTTLAVICSVDKPANLGDTWYVRSSANGDAEYITITKHDTPVPTSIKGICATSKYAWEDAVFHQIVFEGAGTAASPYLIKTVADYQALGTYSKYVDWANTYFKLANNIEVNEGDASTWGSKAPSIKSIAIGNEGVPFCGTFDGNNKMLKGVYIDGNGTDESGIGIFGSTGKDAYIHNLKISNSCIYGKNKKWVGGIVGLPTDEITIENCYVASDVYLVAGDGSSCNAGGIVGGLTGELDYSCTITSCAFIGTITGDGNYVGGILGNANNNSNNSNFRNPVIEKCLFAGSVVGKAYVTGIVGRSDARGYIVGNVSVGEIYSKNGSPYVAGIFASSTSKENADDNVTIKNNYCTHRTPWVINASKYSGLVTATGNNVYSYMDFFGSSALSISGFTRRSNDIMVPTGVKDMAGTILSARIETGASVRISNPTGIRFTAEFSDKYLDSFGDDLVSYGVIVAPTSYVSSAGGFTFEKLDAYSANNGNKQTYLVYSAKPGAEAGGTNAKVVQNTNYQVINAVLGNVKSANYENEFTARTFVAVNVDGAVKVYYSNYNTTDNSRSIATVARLAVEDVSETSKTGYTNDFTFKIPTINKTQKSKKWDWDLWEYVYTYTYTEGTASTGHLYRPYTSSQITTLQNFYANEVRVYQQNLLNEYGASNYGDDVVVSSTYQTQQERGVRMLKQVEKYRPDVMGFCEDSEYWVAYIKAALNSTYSFYDTMDWDKDINEANLVVYKTSRFTKTDGNVFSLGDTYTFGSQTEGIEYDGETYHSHYARFVRWAKLQDSVTGKTFIMAATHFDHNGKTPYAAGKLIRQQEAIKAREKFATVADECGLFFVGDFNDGWSVECIREMMTTAQANKITSGNTGNGEFRISGSYASIRYMNSNNYTYHYYNERTFSRLDYCFYKEAYATPLRYRIIDEKFAGTTASVSSYPSDHYGLLSDFILK